MNGWIRSRGWVFAGALGCLAAGDAAPLLVNAKPPYLIRVKQSLPSVAPLKDGVYFHEGFPMANVIENAQLISDAVAQKTSYCALLFREREAKTGERYVTNRVEAGEEFRVTRITTDALAKDHWVSFVVGDPKSPVASLYCDGLVAGAQATVEDVREILGQRYVELLPAPKT